MAILTRETNGTGVTNNDAPLTNTQLDNNFIELVAADATKQPLDADLTAIAGLTGTEGFLKKTAANTWELDTAPSLAYLPITGGTMTGNITFSDDQEGIVWSRNTDSAYIKFFNTADGDSNSRLEYATADNGTEYHRWVHFTPGSTEYELMALRYNTGVGDLTVTGAVGIGTTNPSTALDVTGTITADGLTVDGETDGTAVALLRADNNSVTKKNTLRFEDTDTTTQNDQQIGRIEFYSNDTEHTGVDAVIEAVSATTALKELRFLTSDTANTPLSRLAINRGGDISFYEDTGTTAKFFWDASAERLEIYNDGDALKLGNSSGTETAYMSVQGSRGLFGIDDSSGTLTGANGAVFIKGGNSRAIALNVNNTTDPAVFISTAGNVGIGTTSPSDQLTVNGDVRIGSGDSTSDMYLRGGATTAVSVGGSTSAAIVTTKGTSSGAFHVGIEVPSNDQNDGFYIATDSDQDGVVDTLAMKINADGNVGIGTTSPSAKLTAAGITGTTIIQAFGGDTNGFADVEIKSTGTSGQSRLFFSDTAAQSGSIKYDHASNSMQFSTSANERMRIDSDGNVTLFSGSIILPDFGIVSSTATTTSTTQTAILSFSSTTYAGAKIVVTATTGVNRHICELLVAHDGTTAIATQYGSVTTASDLTTYDVDISGGNVRLLATSASATSTVYKVSGTLMEA